MRTPAFRPMQDKSVDNVLCYLRACIVRDGLDGLEHVEALLRLRGIEPADVPVPRKWSNHFRRSELRRSILDALRPGPLTLPDLAGRVGGDLDRAAAYGRTYRALQKMHAAGLVSHEGRLWSGCQRKAVARGEGA